MMTDSAAELVATALDYPFPRPGHSFLFADGEVLALADCGADALDAVLAERNAAPLAERTAVLAYGANAAPIRLERKFASQAPGAVFPVIEARLRGFDIVYAGHFSSYAALPATPAPSPSTTVSIAVTYLDGDQLARMHETELSRQSYIFGRLDGLALELDGVGALESVHSYWTRYGAFVTGGSPLALAAIAAEGRRFPAAEQDEAQSLARDHLAPGRDLRDFVAETVSELAVCQERSRALSDGARPFDHPHREVLVT